MSDTDVMMSGGAAMSSQNVEEAMSSGGDYLAAETMKKKDITDIINDLLDPMTALNEIMSKFREGGGYDAAGVLVDTLNTRIQSGLWVAFRLKNDFLGDKEQRASFLKLKSSIQSVADKQAIVELYDFFGAAEPILNNYALFLSTIKSNLKPAFQAIRYEMTMFGVNRHVKMAEILMAFQVFRDLHMEFNDAKIYNYVDANRTKYSYEQNLQKVTQYMNVQLKNKRFLKTYLAECDQLSSYGHNVLSVLDEYTSDYKEHASRVVEFKNAEDEVESTARTITAKLRGRFGATIEMLCSTWIQMNANIGSAFYSAGSAIGAFEEKKGEEPYNLLHYDDFVVTTVNHFFLGSIDNPLNSGTKYLEFFKGMTASFSSLAKAIAKNAPKD